MCLSLDGFVVYWFLWKGELTEVIGKMTDMFTQKMLNPEKPKERLNLSICECSPILGVCGE